ncbi:MAG TPA: acyl-CoA dehydrogenase family protein [Pyrinomonadaceae bacterium]|jgi:alkylation response protein AidB-like acyl-CoA dehydrogenase|nr:acyl-CoA dehydrogenase family protein [Pyrinomonadaceae bacterium]
MPRDRFFEETPFFTDEHARLAAGVSDFAAREVEPHAAADAEGDADAHFRVLLSLLAQADLLRYSVARGDAAPLDARALCVVREALSYHSPLADLAFVMQGLGTYAISLAAAEHVRDFWLERARAGKSIAAFALTEPEAGSDVAAIQTAAVRDADGYRISGRKCFISNAGLADFYTVFARTGTRGDGRAELSAFIVGARIPGFRVVARTPMVADHPIGEIEFKDVRVPSENLVGTEGDGFRLAMLTMDMFRASVGAAGCGMARRALDEAVHHAKTRRQFGVTLAMHQLIQEKLAVMQTELDAARLLVYRAAHLKDGGATGSSMTRAASQAKLYATEAAQRIIDEAVQIHGGYGLVRGHPVERLYRDVRALRIYEGTSEIQKLIIARELLKE